MRESPNALLNQRASQIPAGGRRLFFERSLFLIFLFSLPLLNPWVRGDGVGYYALARAPLIQHNLDFQRDYLEANATFRALHVDESGQPNAIFRTRTGHLDNRFTVGPAILWWPFLFLVHVAVLLARAAGAHVAADGFSAPYRIAMAAGTAVYGFLGILISFRLARKYVAESWAFLAAVGIWWASSLPVYMYFNPSWSHAHSAFAVALFVWYWHETRDARTRRQWIFLGVIAGIMLNVYYPNLVLLVVLLVEGLRQYAAVFRTQEHSGSTILQLASRHFVFAGTVLLSLTPTFATRFIIYGHPLESGYYPLSVWLWRSPAFLQVLFSSNHGLLVWTPIILFAAVGLFLFQWWKPEVGTPLLAAALAFYIFIACFPNWAGMSSFGNRFFISLTPLFILGLAVLLERIATLFRNERAALTSVSALLAFFILWNCLFIFQWGAHLIPVRGPISWSEMIHNQFFVAPREIAAEAQRYLFRRGELMREIERRDTDQLKLEPVP